MVIAALYDAPLPALRGSEFTSTQFDFVPVAMVLIALGLYLWAVRRNNALHPRHPWSVGKTVAFLGALFTTGVAIFSFVGVYDGELFWDHMVQHLLLIMVAAPLFAISSPSTWPGVRRPERPTWWWPRAFFAGRQVPRPPDCRLRSLRRVDSDHASDQLV